VISETSKFTCKTFANRTFHLPKYARNWQQRQVVGFGSAIPRLIWFATRFSILHAVTGLSGKWMPGKRSHRIGKDLKNVRPAAGGIAFAERT